MSHLIDTSAFPTGDDIDYEWVWNYAEARYAHYAAIFDSLDGKAGAIITYLGGGTGLFTLMTTAAVATDKRPFQRRSSTCWSGGALRARGACWAGRADGPPRELPPLEVPGQQREVLHLNSRDAVSR